MLLRKFYCTLFGEGEGLLGGAAVDFADPAQHQGQFIEAIWGL